MFVVLIAWAQFALAGENTAQPPAPAPVIPKGEVAMHVFSNSKIFPGTERAYWVYIPRQYDPAKPACLYVSQDGLAWNAPAVFDQLIQEKAMPVTVGLFVAPGRVPVTANRAYDRVNRSYEYDAMSDEYVRFLLDELLPHVVKEHKLNLSSDGNDRAIAGASSGGICAFTAAWERPDAFRRVFSSIGSFAGFRGGNAYPTLIRMVEPKPIRIFLQDGRHDLNIAGGDWWLLNQEIERAFRFAGYEVEHAWDEGGHEMTYSAKIFPQAMRWLWKDWPKPVTAGAGSNHHRDILLPGETWTPVAQGFHDATGLAVNAHGEVFFNDAPANKTYKVGLDGKTSVLLADSNHGAGAAFGPDGRLYTVAAGNAQCVAYDAEGHAKVIADGIRGHGAAVDAKGNLYVTEPGASEADGSRVWLVTPAGEKRVVDSGLKVAAGVTFTCDQAFLCVSDSRTHWVYSYRIEPDGGLADKQRFYYLHVPDAHDDSGADGMCVDRNGRLYVATRLGIQVCDREGRGTCIIPTPNGKVSGICFGGAAFDTLLATCGDRVFQRKVKVHGACAFQPPIPPTALGL
jgi:sugar lactone lactonase YvrE/enterochelin esterase-like enzyme